MGAVRINGQNVLKKRLSHNKRFGEIAGALRHHELATSSPADSSVEPATTQSRHHVRHYAGTAQW